MHKIIILTAAFIISALSLNAQNQANEIKQLSKDKWLWMSDKNVHKLADLFHDKSMFIHMGGTWGKEKEWGRYCFSFTRNRG